MTKGQKPKKKSKPSAVPASNTSMSPLIPSLISWMAYAVLLLAAISRIFLGNVPMTRDEGTYSYMGRLAMKGFTPYQDFYEMKPPALYYLYGAGASIFGYTDLGLRIFGLVVNLISAFLLYLIIKRYAGHVYAVVAAALFTLMTINPYTFGLTMVAEHIVNPLLLLAFYLAHKGDDKKGVWWLILAGVSFALAILTKQTAIVISPVFLLLFLFQKSSMHWFRQCLYFAGGVLIPAVLFFTGIWVSGAWSDAMYWLITYPANYSSSIAVESGLKLLDHFFFQITLFQVTLFMVSGIAILGNLILGRQKSQIWLFAYLLFALITIIPGLRFYGQYWLLSFAPLAMLVAMLLHHLDALKRKTGMMAAGIIVLCMFFEMATHSEYYFIRGKSKEVEKLFSGNPFEPIRKLSRYARDQMKPDETLMMFGSEPQVYLYAEQPSPTRHVFMAMLSEDHEKTPAYAEEVMVDLREKKPTYVLFNVFPYSWGITKNSNRELYTDSYLYVKNQYSPVATYDMNQHRYLYASDGATIDVNQPNQVILFKHR